MRYSNVFGPKQDPRNPYCGVISKFIESIDQGTAAPVMSLAMSMRFTSQDQEGYDFKLLSMMRNAFGGHAVKKAGE